MHPRYLDQVLRDRGIPAPPLKQLEAFTNALAGADEARITRLLPADRT